MREDAGSVGMRQNISRPTSLIDVGHPFFERGSPIALLGTGFSSEVFLVGSIVVKVNKFQDGLKVAQTRMRTMEGEYRLIKNYLGDYAVDTAYELAESRSQPDTFRVLTLQSYIGGMILKDAGEPGLYANGLRELLTRSLRMFDETGRIPDLAGVKGVFNVYRNNNVVLPDDSTDKRPALVDTNFGNFQRKSRVGVLFSHAIAFGAKRALEKI